MSLNYLATRFTCSWPWSTLVLLCDGRMVCGCADPYAKRVLGDARRDSVSSIWTGEPARRLRTDLNGGGAAFCGDCPLKLPLADTEAPPQRDTDVGALPRRLYVECTAACNISCFQSCCAPETGITKTRQTGMLDFDLFRRVVDEAAPSLGRIDFFNYGEAFLHKRAVEMCEYIKTHHPHIYLYTSTNGIMLNDASARRLVQSGIDEVTFSIDGASQAVYARYRQRGDFAKAIANLRTMVDEKHRNGAALPFLNWRYILFTWNDHDAEMNRARQMAADIGVDRLCWEITDHPEDGYSRRFVPGTADYDRIRHAVWDSNGLGSAVPGGTPRARIEVRGHRTERPIVSRRGEPVSLDLRVRNLSRRPFLATAPHGRRLVRVGAQLCGPDGAVLDRDFARAWLPKTIDAGDRADLAVTLTAPAHAGDYRLKFDLVCEGVDWFENCGSETTARKWLVS